MSTDVEVPQAVNRPLKPSEAAAAKRLVKNSYETLRAELAKFCDEQIVVAKQRVREEFADKQREAEVIQRRINRQMSKAWKKRAAAIREASAAGMEIDERGYRRDYWDVTVKVGALTRALADAEREVRAAYDRAMLDLRTKELEAERVILVASLSVETERVVMAIPTAEEAMRARLLQQPVATRLGLTDA